MFSYIFTHSLTIQRKPSGERSQQGHLIFSITSSISWFINGDNHQCAVTVRRQRHSFLERAFIAILIR